MIVVAVGLAGALGALARYGISLASLRWLGPGFPFGTLIVNLVGCFLLGALAEWTLEDPTLSPQARTALSTGFLGAFTTFSTFGVETFRALEGGDWGVALANVLINVLGGLALVAVGISAVRTLN